MGLLLLVVITSASVQDRDGARTLLDRVKMAMPSLSLLWADGGYAGRLVDWAEAVAHITVEIVRKPVGISDVARRFHGGGWSSAHSPGS